MRQIACSSLRRLLVYQIKNLEDELGQKLFERTSRSLTLTETGRSLLAGYQTDHHESR